MDTQRPGKLRVINDILGIIVILLGVYIIAAPFLPQASWVISKPNPKKAESTINTAAPIGGATLTIPRLELHEQIHTGNTSAELNKGTWLVPKTSTPDKESNTVIVGHRFTYAGPAVFYFLDKVQHNDKIYVDWQQKRYTYQVKLIKVVPPSEVSVHAPTNKPQLTLYTCTPLLTAKDRLVIVSELVKVET